jgi:hypothetical protein
MGQGTIFYVHGAGNREADASAYEGALRSGFKLAANSSKLKRSAWGERRGPDKALPRLDSVLPAPAMDAGFGPVGAQADLTDPLAPLRALGPMPGGAGPAGGAAFVPGAALGGNGGVATAVAGSAARPADSDQLLLLLQAGLVDLDELGISAESLQRAATTVATSPEYAAADGRAEVVVDATLESVAAMAIKEEGAGAFGVGDIGAAIGKAAGGIAHAVLGSGVLSVAGEWVGTHLGPGLKLALSRRLDKERSSLMHKGVLVPADVLFYQRNGAAVRDFVRDEISKLEPPVAAMGHSLGGIILVDTLFGPDAVATNVKLLVTFGSQSAFLESVSALSPVKPTLPWINIWTRYDFASFLAGKIWPGKVTDVEVPIEIGFPDAHGAYYATAGFFDEIRAQPIVQSILA